MSSTIENISVCPHCEADLSTYVDQKTPTSKIICWNCGRQLKNLPNKHFQRPNYLFHQKNKLVSDLSKAKLQPGDSKYEELKENIRLDLINWARDCSSENRMAALYDARCILEHLMFTATPSSDLNTLIYMAKKIGELGNALEQYFKARGAGYDRKARPIRPDVGDDSWNQAAATAGRDT